MRCNHFVTRVKSRWGSRSTSNTSRPAESECEFKPRRNWNRLTGASISCASAPTTARRRSETAQSGAPWCTYPASSSACEIKLAAVKLLPSQPTSRVDQMHHLFRIARSRGGARGKDFVQTAQVIRSQFQIHRRGVFLEILTPLRAGDGDNVVTLRQHPGERQLCRLTFFFARDLFHFLYQIQILLKVFALEARRQTAIIIRRQVFELLELAGKKPASERTVGDKADSEFAAGRQDFHFRIARPQRILRLQRRDGMHFHRAPQRLFARL